MNNQDMIKATKVLKAVANEKRLKILYNIKDNYERENPHYG